jgi:hypothetical protein
MSKQSLIDSLPVGPRVTDGKDPMRDLPVGGRRPTPTPLEEHERRLLTIFRVWMKHPTAVKPLETLSEMMLAHEIRAHNVKAQTT